MVLLEADREVTPALRLQVGHVVGSLGCVFKLPLGRLVLAGLVQVHVVVYVVYHTLYYYIHGGGGGGGRGGGGGGRGGGGGEGKGIKERNYIMHPDREVHVVGWHMPMMVSYTSSLVVVSIDNEEAVSEIEVLVRCHTLTDIYNTKQRERGGRERERGRGIEGEGERESGREGEGERERERKMGGEGEGERERERERKKKVM